MLFQKNKDDNCQVLRRENERLAQELEEARQTLEAIRQGDVDAIVIHKDEQTSVRHIVEQEILAQSILEQVADAVIICDREGNIVRASRAVGEFAGGDPLGKHFDGVYPLFVVRDGRKIPFSFASIAEKKNIKGLDVCSEGAAGEDFYLMLSVGPLYSEEEDLLGLVVTLTDITERKHSESLLRQSDQHKNEFLAILAHELRNPIAPLQNALQVMEMSEDPDLRQKAQQIMGRQLKQMVRLVDDLMDVSRIARNVIELRRQTLNFSQVIESAVETSGPLMEDRGHKLSVQMPAQSVYIDGDLTRLSQIFLNLLNNAAKYTPDGGQISLNTEVKGDRVYVTVKDNGIGIDSSMLLRIFEMFAQADTSLERAHGGLGIGLTLVKNLLALHGGSIEARSGGQGKGSEFIVSLPVSHVAPDAVQADEKDAAQPAKKLRVMVLDDNHASAQTIGWMLELMGHDYELSFDGRDFIEQARRFRPDAILMDIGLPGKNGYEICGELRQMPEFAKTIMIAQTGWGQQKDRDSAKEAGFDHHMVKPIDYNAIEKILAT